MKIVLELAAIEFLLLINCLQQISLAAPTLESNKDATAIDVERRGAEYRNLLFRAYSCRVIKAADAVSSKLQVRLLVV